MPFGWFDYQVWTIATWEYLQQAQCTDNQLPYSTLIIIPEVELQAYAETKQLYS